MDFFFASLLIADKILDPSDEHGTAPVTQHLPTSSQASVGKLALHFQTFAD